MPELIEIDNVAYFVAFRAARDHGAKHCRGYPNWRVVAYATGFAVQVRISGPYLNHEGEVALDRKEVEPQDAQV